jgi:hypothetical protein
MFGLGGFGRSQPVKKPERPLPARQAEPDESPPFTLVSIEDIYRVIKRLKTDRSGEPVLLLKKGIEVEADQLPRLMKNGANPSQFRIKQADGERLSQFATASALESAQVTNPLFEVPAALARTLRSRKRALVLDVEPKSMRRLMDCLFMCGFQLDNIHPVRIPSSLNWALQKYRPHVLVVDYQLSGKQNGIQVLQTMQPSLPFLEQVILIVPPLATLHGWEVRRLEAFCKNRSIFMLPKPVNRFTLKQILDESIRDSRPRTQS